MIGNVPESAGQAASDLWSAVSSPFDTAKALGGAAVGAIQLGKEALGVPVVGSFGQHQDTARAVGSYFADRYGGGQEFLDSLRSDPVGVALDAGGVLTGGAAAAARLPGTAGRLARAITRVDPVAAGGRAVGRAMQARRGPREFIEGAPSPSELQTKASSLFEAAGQSGIKFKPDYYNKFVDDTLGRMVDEGADPILSPKISRIADVLEKTKGNAPSIAQLAIVRKQFGNAAGSIDPAERRLGAIGVDMVDDFVESGASAVGGTLAEARALWSRLRKSEIIDDAIATAEVSQAGTEAGLRNAFRSLYKARNTRRMRGFSADELSAIRAVAEGNFASNILRRIGSLGGGLDQGRNMMNLMAGVGGGALVGGPIGAAMVPLAGYGAARLAKQQTSNRAALARAIAARGEMPGKSNVSRPQGAAQPYLPGTLPVVAPVLLGTERSQDPRRRR